MITQPLVEHTTVSDLKRAPAVIFKDEKQRVNRTEYVPSITERTTDLLGSSASTRVRQKEDGESQA